MFEKGLQREGFGSEREDVARGWRMVHKGDLCDVHCTQNVVRVIADGWGMWHGWDRIYYRV